MQQVHQWGLGLIILIQHLHGPHLDMFFRGVSLLGTEPFYLLLLPLLYWCIDYRNGARLTVIFLLSVTLNILLKDFCAQPRPFNLDPAVKLDAASGYGFPSGHAQLAVTVWCLLAAWRGTGRAWAAALTICLLIGFSRVYLGVHFPTDVIGGWLIGAAVVAVYWLLRRPLERGLLRPPLSWQLAAAVVLPLGLLAVHLTGQTATTLPTLAGGTVGLALIHHYSPFRSDGPWRRRVQRFLLGFLIFLVFYVGLKFAFSGEASPLYLYLRALRYILLGLWISLGAPWMFLRLRLAEREQPLAARQAVSQS